MGHVDDAHDAEGDCKPDRGEQQHRTQRQAVPGVLHHRPHCQIALDRGDRAGRGARDIGRNVAGQAGQQRHRFLVAPCLDDGHGFEFFDLGRVGLVEQDGRAGLGKGRLCGLVGFLGERAVDHGKRALLVALEHRLRGRDPLGGIGRQQRQAAEGRLHGAAQAVVEADGSRIIRQLVDGSAGGGIDDLAVGAR